jgi:hypothetical protein
MKKYWLGLVILGSAVSVRANIITCDVTTPKNYSAIQFDLTTRSVNTIDLQSGNQFHRIYTRFPLLRGAYTYTSCSPDINEYKENMQAFLINSRCSGGGVGMSASFYTSLDPKAGGDLAFVRADKEYESVSFANCR